MSDRVKITAGLALFVVLATFPIWRAIGAAKPAPPAPQLPAGGGQCVEDKEWMVANHMALLRQWRDAVVREGGKDYVSKTFGTRCEMSLSKTCMGCHTNRQAFCEQCHGYANVQLTCWNCHLESGGRKP